MVAHSGNKAGCLHDPENIRMHHFTVTVNHQAEVGHILEKNFLFFFCGVNQESPVYPAKGKAWSSQHFLSISEAHSAT